MSEELSNDHEGSSLQVGAVRAESLDSGDDSSLGRAARPRESGRQALRRLGVSRPTMRPEWFHDADGRDDESVT